MTDDILFGEMKNIFENYGEICNRTKFDKLSTYDVTTYRKRFGKWQDILLQFRKWLEQNNVAFTLLEQLPVEQNNQIQLRQDNKQRSKINTWQSIGGTTYGSFLNFRGLQHAPINEQGVVFLFGMICKDLGFIVEAIRSEYPDCEAKRCIDLSRDRWERIRIEFEYQSKHFKEHGHDIKKCDVIVCWEHNWPESPLEVIELRDELLKLREV